MNPRDGAVGSVLRVQARVHHPLGLSAVAAVTLSVSGAGGSSVPMARNPRYVVGADTWIFERTVVLLPGPHALSATATDTSARSTHSPDVAVVVGAPGDGNLLVTDNSSQLCSACHGESNHGSETSGRAYGAWSTTCRDCHAPHGTRNIGLIRESIRPTWVEGTDAPTPREVTFSTRTGFAASGGVASPAQASYANGDDSGPCQVCHTRTVRWRRGETPDAVHRGDCGFCHRHRRGLKAICDDCHAIPPATGAHAAHRGASAPTPTFPSDPRPLGCGNCHPTDPALHGDGAQQVELNGSVTLPGGTTTAGAQLTGFPGGVTCLVACHFPLGAPAPAAPVQWNAGGPLPCRSCHERIDPTGVPPTRRAGPTLHEPSFPEARPASGEPTTCFSCHDAAAHDAAHLTGAPGLLPANAVNAACIACHSPPSGPPAPQGQVLQSGADPSSTRTPVPLPGWSESTVDAASGDFHGGRRGTCFGPYGPAPCAPAVTPGGYGGTLKAPYYRGYPAMPCATCHAGHASDNSFLFAAVVNGTPIPAGSIDRTGVGAERLCEACHAGGRHDRCRACHSDAYYCDSGQCWMDGVNPVDPAPPGSACFVCHGHEGIRRWTSPYGSHGSPPTDCRHCHSGGWAFSNHPPTIVPASYTPPVFSYYYGGAPIVSRISWNAATIAWGTNGPTSTWVEYGVGTPGFVAGSAAESYAHAFTLTGLLPGTTYVWRIRSVDPWRNELETPLESFTTTAADAVPYPDIVPVIAASPVQPATSNDVNLTWYPVAAPTGNGVEYRVQLAEDEAFTTLVNGFPADSGWIPGTQTTSEGRAALFFTVTITNLPPDQCTDDPPYNRYYWRVKARDSITGVESVWSAVSAFNALSADPWGC